MKEFVNCHNCDRGMVPNRRPTFGICGVPTCDVLMYEPCGWCDGRGWRVVRTEWEELKPPEQA